MIKRIKIWVFKKLFPDYDREMRENFKEHIEDYKKSVSITSVLREQLAGFNPRELDKDEMDLLDEVEGEDAENTFLAEMADLNKNNSLKRLFKYLKRNQIIHLAKNAERMDQVNFGRSSINGISLVEEEVERFAGIYALKKKPEEEFDKHEIIN